MICGLRTGAQQAVPLHLMLLLLLLLVALAGCGKKGPVRPLKQPLPAAPRELAIRQLGMGFVLGWDIPEANQNGTPLTDLEGFRIYRMRYDPAEDCPECRDTSILIEEVDLDYLRDVTRRGDRLYFWDTDLKPGYAYKYRVVPFNLKNRDGAPATAQRPMMLPPSPPSGLIATGHDRLVRLHWEPMEEDRQDVEWIGYNLYRHDSGAPFPPRPLNREPLRNPFFEDFDVENEKTYTYALRSVVRILDLTVESSLSEPAEATPREGL